MAKTLIGNVKGPKGADGKNGSNGVTPHIGSNGNWYIGTTDTGIPATGPAGRDGQDGQNGSPGKDGADGSPGKDGAAGQPGADATIESVTAEVDGSYLAQPTVTVTPGGTPSNRTFHFAFKGLRGLSGGGEGGGGTVVQADLSVNDPNDPSYVKERTHWKEVYDGPEGEVIPETSVAFTSNIKTITGAMSDAIHAGGLYIVTWNGTEYQCVGKSGSDGNYIGNGSFMNAGNMTFEDTGEPFCVLLFGGTYYQLWKADTTAETVTVKVVGKKKTVWHKLESGYMPEGYPYSEGVKLTALYSALVEIDPDSGAYEGVADVPLTEGETYVVKYNGVDYSCVCSTMTQGDEYNGMVTFYILGNLGAMMGGDDTGEPFVVMTMPAMGMFGMYALDGSATVDLTISAEAESVQPMAGKFMPKGTPYMQPFDDVILENTVLADVMVESPLGAAYNLPIGAIIPGNIYNVEFDGAVYRTKAYSVTQGEMTAVALGSGVLMGGSAIVGGVPFTGDPFLIQIFPAVIQQAYGFNAAITWDYGFGPEESGTKTIAIRGGYTVNKIDEHCLPDGAAPIWLTLAGSLDGGQPLTANLSRNVIVAALRAKKSVYVFCEEVEGNTFISGPMAAYFQAGYLQFRVGNRLFEWRQGSDYEITCTPT